jgi:hypothetical protein
VCTYNPAPGFGLVPNTTFALSLHKHRSWGGLTGFYVSLVLYRFSIYSRDHLRRYIHQNGVSAAR